MISNVTALISAVNAAEEEAKKAFFFFFEANGASNLCFLG